jgi:PKD repeat protein
MKIEALRNRAWTLGLCLALAVAVKSCGNSADSVQSPNSPPEPAVRDDLTGAPPDGSTGQLTRPVLSWKCTDVDGDPLRFDLYLGTDPVPPLYSADRITSCMVPGPLEFNTTYYWFVVARDDHGQESRSGTWSFRTRADVLRCGASGGPLVGPPPLVVDFVAEASEGVPPYTYHWMFGDGNTAILMNPSHVYTLPGTYIAVFKVTDAEQSTCSKALDIIVEGPPSCNGKAVPSAGPPPLAVSFVATATGGQTPYTYFWDFADGYTSTDQNPTHTYPHPGDYIVILEVTGADGRACQSPLAVTVGPVLMCDATGNPVSGPLPLTVRFSGYASAGKGPYTFAWTLGDGTSSSAQNPVHTYSRSGPFTVVLTVGDSGGSTCSKSFRVIAGI